MTKKEQIKRLKTENERLRRTLRVIQTWASVWGDGHAEAQDEMNNIARRCNRTLAQTKRTHDGL